MDEFKKSIEIAQQNGLFNDSESSVKDQVFDFYGNYNFPTDFSISEGNTIFSVSQYEIPINNETQNTPSQS